MTELIQQWESRCSWMLAYAEEAFYAGEHRKANYFEALARQWRSAVEELRKIMPSPQATHLVS